MLLVTVVGNILNQLYLPGDIIVSAEGFQFEIITPETFILSILGVESRYLCDISQVSESLSQHYLPSLEIDPEAPHAFQVE